jgi:hypothetical protein
MSSKARSRPFGWLGSPLVLAAVAVIAAIVPASAGAKPKVFPTQVSLAEGSADYLSGELANPLARCLRDRTVELTQLGSGAPLLSLRTDDAGRFTIAAADLPLSGASLEVRVLPKPVRGNKTCGSDAVELSVDHGTLTGGVAGSAFGGKLSSSIGACVPVRRIEIFEVSSEPVFVGWNLTDSTGEWFLAAAGGTYEARAVPVLLGGPESFSWCRARFSAPWSFEESG